MEEEEREDGDEREERKRGEGGRECRMEEVMEGGKEKGRREEELREKVRKMQY